MGISGILSLVTATYAAVLALLVLWRAPRHPAHLSFTVGMLVLAAETVLAALANDPGRPGAAARWPTGWLTALALVPAPWLYFSVCYARGDFRQSIRRWSPAVLALLIVPLGLVAGFHTQLTLPPDPLLYPSREMLRLGWAGVTLNLLGVLSSVVILTNLERTFRDSVGVLRWRLKYMVLGLGVLFVFRLYTGSQTLLYSSLDLSLQPVQSGALLLACLLISVALGRSRLFDVDVYLSRAVLFRSLTILIAGIYLLVVGFFAQAVEFLGHKVAFPLQAFFILAALVGLAVALLSERFRRRIHEFVSRHFQRPVYDYRQTWATFTAKTTSLVDEPAFCRAVVGWVSDTFRVLSVNLWLLDENQDRLRFGGSTSLNESGAAELAGHEADWTTLIRAMIARPEPLDLDASNETWVLGLRRLNPGVFPQGGHRVCLPLCAGGELLGVIMLGDRVSGHPFSAEDLDLLKCVGDQVAAGLLNLQLSRRLLQAKELEAFQTMSAFFVHDLKNTASTLSLMLQNLRDHFGNPAFRDDALRVVGKSVQHLNDLIGRLSQLRQELAIQPVAAELAPVVELALTQAGPLSSVNMVKELLPGPPVRLDPEQMQKVVLNLVLNARDAVGDHGNIRVATSATDGWAVLTVTDDGCGMTPEFVRRSLFRPFQTTKKRGIGIGMFQSKMIVGAHGGRFEVDSTPGQGTTFRVLLPPA